MIESGTMFERGDLLLVPFPFTDLSANKRRPVLALTGPDSYGDFIAMPVTSRPQSKEHGLALRSGDIVRGSLAATSWIRTDRIVTLSGRLVLKSLARLAEPVVVAAAQRLCARIVQAPPIPAT
jgi:mRNA interferase MazF